MVEQPGGTPPLPTRPDAGPKKRFPTPLQAVVLTLAGAAMTFFGCLGALTQFSQSDVLFGIALVVCLVGALAFSVGLLIVAFMFVKGVVKAYKDSRAGDIAASPPDDLPGPRQ